MGKDRMRIALIAAVILAVAGAAAAQAPAPADTAAAAPGAPEPAPADTVVVASGGVTGVKFVPQYTGGIRGNVDRVSLQNRFTANLTLPHRMTSVTTLSTEEANYRLQDRQDMNKNLMSSLIYPVMPGLIFDGSISDTRYFNRVVTVSNSTQDIFNNVQKAQANASWSRVLWDGISFNTKASGGVGQSEQTFLNDHTQDGAARFGLQYRWGGRVSATAIGALHYISQDAESGGRGFSGLGTAEDSVVARASAVVLDSTKVRAEYVRFLSKEDYLELPRDSFGAQQFDASKISPEQQSKDNRNLSVGAETTPLTGLTLKFEAAHSDGATYFAEAKERTRRDTGDSWSAGVAFGRGDVTLVTVDYESKDYFHWLGPVSIGSFDDQDRRLRLSWNQKITGTLRMTAQGGVSLTQSFYVDTDRDRDQKYQFANVRLNSDLFPKVAATIYVSVTRTDYLSIRSAFSQNNRTETVYELRPEFVYKINNRISIAQKYGLNIQFADYIFQESENFLDRNVTFSNLVHTQLLTNTMVEFYYAYQLHDKGSYLRPDPDAERVLVVNQKERRDEVELRLRYQMTKHLAVLGMNEYIVRKDILRSSSAPFEDGGLELGVDGSYDLWGQGNLKLAMKRVKRFGRFNVDAQKDYWVMDSSINYTF
jgi:hypothetical protein